MEAGEVYSIQILYLVNSNRLPNVQARFQHWRLRPLLFLFGKLVGEKQFLVGGGILPE